MFHTPKKEYSKSPIPSANHQIFSRDSSNITVKKQAYDANPSRSSVPDKFQSDIDMVLQKVNNEVMRQNEMRLRRLQKELEAERTQDIFVGSEFIKLIANQEIIHQRTVIQQLEIENQMLLRQLAEFKQRDQIAGDQDKSQTIVILQEEVESLKKQVIDLQKQQQPPEQKEDKNEKELITLRQNCNDLLQAQEEILSSNNNLIERLSEINKRAQKFESYIQEQNNTIQSLKSQIKSLNIQLLDRDNQILALRQIMASNPKVEIKFPPALKYTSLLGSPMKSRSPSPVKVKQPSQDHSPLRSKQNTSAQPEKIFYIQDCKVAIEQ